MDSGKTKRKARKPASASAQKRRKVQSSGPAKKTPKRTVHLNSLQWRSVDVPEMFNDAEGFYGLEEVDGVDVVRDGGTVRFETSAVSPEESEFEGFGDEPSDARDGTPKKSKDSGKQLAGKEKKPKKGDMEADNKTNSNKTESNKKKASSAARGGDAELEANVFSKLGDFGDPSGEEEGADVSAWAPLDLSPSILSCIARLKFANPTAIQSAAIPRILGGADVVGKASTGSGKTLAFAIPIVEHWLAVQGTAGQARHHPTALVLSPTRELAHQITQHFKDLCSGLPAAPYVCPVTGGLAVQKQQRQLEKADVVIATPGRLWEVLSSSSALLSDFKKVRFLVVDEADRLLSEGHFKEAEEIFNALDRTVDGEDAESEDDESSGKEEDDEQWPKDARDRQTLVFSATFNKGLQQKLAGKGRYDLMGGAESMEYLLKRLNFRAKPEFVDVNPVSQMAERLKEGMIECGAMEKDLYLYATLMLRSSRRTLVFTNSISSVRRLTPLLQNLGLPAIALHSEMAQKARLRSIERFTASKVGSAGEEKAAAAASILVATDVAARGLDIPGIELVVHYHVPRAADAYVHRSGRTARAETSGLSILLCAPEEVTPTRRLVAKVHAAASHKAATGEKKADGSQPDRFFIRTVDIDRRLVSRLKERVVLAKRIADAALAKERGGKEDNWMRAAADELGVEYDSDETELAGRWGGRGGGRKKKEEAARQLTKAETGALRAELKALLSKRINQGVSERYITSGGVDVSELLKGDKSDFLGGVDGFGLDDLL